MFLQTSEVWLAHLEAVQRQLQAHLKQQEQHTQLRELFELFLVAEQPATQQL